MLGLWPVLALTVELQRNWPLLCSSSTTYFARVLITQCVHRPDSHL